ncbi:MAG: hypothetical protein ACREPX_09080 [Rhodanobacteraceae bacterium]
MSGHDGLIDPSADTTLAAALRALPESAPQPDLWPELARTLQQRRNRRVWRYALPAAIAAGIAIAMLMPRSPVREDAVPIASIPATSTTPAASAQAAPEQELAKLHQRSKTLERWIAAVAARAPQDSRDLMAAVEVEDLIGLVDVQLGGARGDADALPLWRQRVALLEDLATIRGSAFARAENDSDARADAASIHLIN